MKIKNYFRKSFFYFTLKVTLISCIFFSISHHSVAQNGISDESWSQIAGTHLEETYKISKGDSLSSVSSRLFGDSNYWPKIWAINKQSITNPHMIQPNEVISFHSGSGNELPQMSIGTHVSKQSQYLGYSSGSIPTTDEHTRPRSNEYKKLTNPPWEKIPSITTNQFDKDGFDKKNFQKTTRPSQNILPIGTNESKDQSFARITKAFSLSSSLSAGDKVVIESEKELKENEVYQVISNYSSIQSDGRRTYAFRNLGQVTIRGKISLGYTAIITKSFSTIMRGDLITTAIENTDEPRTQVAPSEIQAQVFWSNFERPDISTQHDWVILDKGKKDGIQAGMIFKTFQSEDQYLKYKFNEDLLFVTNDIKVFKAEDEFSIAHIIRSNSPLSQGEFAVSISDVKELKQLQFWNGKGKSNTSDPQAPSVIDDLSSITPTTDSVSDPNMSLDSNPNTNVDPSSSSDPNKSDENDWLDQLDDKKDLDPNEETELKKLEDYQDKNPLPTAPATLDVTDPLLSDPTMGLDPALNTDPAPDSASGTDTSNSNNNVNPSESAPSTSAELPLDSNPDMNPIDPTLPQTSPAPESVAPETNPPSPTPTPTLTAPKAPEKTPELDDSKPILLLEPEDNPLPSTGEPVELPKTPEVDDGLNLE